MKIKVKKLKENAVLPSYAHEGDAGMDVYSVENSIILPGKRKMISTGISIEIPSGYVALVWDKSGIAAKQGITILGGVIDAHYRGEYKIILFNTSDDNFEVRIGDKIAQVLIQKIESAEIEEVDELSETKRGEGGFGSTGIR
ncbi:MAG: dUTP diphosphatase [archaeon]|nr:dUTP diphosphatase [archaeon]MCR4323773.1 dUTP diphosphatase [Nanoarchaeota archaeon]